MAATTCTAAGLVTAGACFTEPNFGEHDQNALIAYLWWQWADSVTNTVTTLATQLTDSACIAQGLKADALQAGVIGILNRGSAGSGTIETSIAITALTKATAATAIACFKNVPDSQIEAIKVYNMCRFFGALSA